VAQVRFRPYDLVVVQAKDVEPEHFTMSSSGVVHMRPDGPSEFLSVSDWMREASQFNVIASMCGHVAQLWHMFAGGGGVVGG
jgi:hypothetical protein